MPQETELHLLLTYATLVCAALKVGPIIFFAFQRGRLRRMQQDRVAAFLYLLSKLGGILTIAFALAAAASAGRSLEVAGLSGLLLIGGALTFRSVFGRLVLNHRGLLDRGEAGP